MFGLISGPAVEEEMMDELVEELVARLLFVNQVFPEHDLEQVV